MAEDQGDKAMNQLQSKWYNTVVKAIGGDPNSFQMIQASSPLGNTSDTVWQFFNSVPPASLNQVFSQSAVNSFYDDYKAIMMTVMPQTGDKFRSIMGDFLVDWDTYKKTLTPKDLGSGGLLGVFEGWAQLNLPTDIIKPAITAYQQLMHDPVSVAVNALLNSKNQPNADGIPTFNKTIQDLKDALVHAKSLSFDFDSDTASSDTSSTWASGEIGGSYDFFSASGGGSYKTVSEKASSSKVTVKGTFNHIVSFSAKPSAWFNSGGLNIAYGTSDNTVWPAGVKPDWDTSFGDKGNFKRLATELVVYDGLDLTITSEAQYTSSEQTEIKANASIGFWPFFSASASGGHSTGVTFSDQGTMTVKMSVPVGNPAVLGVNVLGIDQFLGNALGVPTALIGAHLKSLAMADAEGPVPNACTYNGHHYDSGSQVCMPQPNGKSKQMICQRDGHWHWTRNYCD